MCLGQAVKHTSRTHWVGERHDTRLARRTRAGAVQADCWLSLEGHYWKAHPSFWIVHPHIGRDGDMISYDTVLNLTVLYITSCKTRCGTSYDTGMISYDIM
jgi:hypothetical protein